MTRIGIHEPRRRLTTALQILVAVREVIGDLEVGVEGGKDLVIHSDLQGLARVKRLALERRRALRDGVPVDLEGNVLAARERRLPDVISRDRLDER
jgi:hypothetical protein